MLVCLIEITCLGLFLVIILCEYEGVRPFMVRACILGMCNGEYFFLYAWLLEPVNDGWRRGDALDPIAKEAYKYLIHVKHEFFHMKGIHRNLWNQKTYWPIHCCWECWDYRHIQVVSRIFHPMWGMRVFKRLLTCSCPRSWTSVLSMW